ncbi:MAG: hypothetical protein IKE52_07250 [Mogibacterium sp.]|nr:hypothetical protein [Mogibacterium sp.]
MSKRNSSEKRIINVRIGDTDMQIMKILHKVPWMFDRHIALLLGLPVKYIRRRLQTLAQGGLVKRMTIGAGDPAVNYITAHGMREVGLELRNASTPSFNTYLHDMGMIDTYVYLSLFRMKTGEPFVNFGSIITERDFLSVTEMQPTGRYKSNGQPILKSMNDGIHEPDGYLFRDNVIMAIEFERVLKSKKSNSQMKDNVIDLSKRFDKQIWVYGNNSVKKKLEEIRDEVPGIMLVNYDVIKEYLDYCLTQLPSDIPKRTGVPAVQHLGELRQPIALHKIPIKKAIRLESDIPEETSPKGLKLER